MAEIEDNETEEELVDWTIEQETWKLESFVEGNGNYRLTKKRIASHSESVGVLLLNDIDLDELAKLLGARRALEGNGRG